MLARALHNTLGHTPTTPTPATFDPMAMEIDNISIDPSTRALLASVQSLTVAVNAMSNQFNSRPPQQQQQQPRLARLTDQEREHLRAHNGCFKCRRVNAGHLSYNCRSVNHIAAESIPVTQQSGNAPSN